MEKSALDVPVFQIGDIVRPLPGWQAAHGSYERKVVGLDYPGAYVVEDKKNSHGTRVWASTLLELVRPAKQPDNEYGEVCP